MRLLSFTYTKPTSSSIPLLSSCELRTSFNQLKSSFTPGYRGGICTSPSFTYSSWSRSSRVLWVEVRWLYSLDCSISTRYRRPRFFNFLLSMSETFSRSVGTILFTSSSRRYWLSSSSSSLSSSSPSFFLSSKSSSWYLLTISLRSQIGVSGFYFRISRLRATSRYSEA